MLVGAHVSIAGGFDKCLDRVKDLGANCLQTFASSPRTLAFKPIDQEIIDRYLQKKKDYNLKLHLFHGIYLINLAHENPEMVDKAIESLTAYQELAGKIGGMGTVFHIGSHKGRGLDAVIKDVASAIVKVLANTPDNVKLYLENAAGHKGTIGQTFSELGQIIEEVASQKGDMDKLRVCIDTQHAFAGGYDLTTNEGIKKMITEADSAFGLNQIEAIHINDSLTSLGSMRDRHANVGEGEIGESGLKMVVNHPQLKHLPFFLEVPGENKSGPRAIDVTQLKSLIES